MVCLLGREGQLLLAALDAQQGTLLRAHCYQQWDQQDQLRQTYLHHVAQDLGKTHVLRDRSPNKVSSAWSFKVRKRYTELRALGHAGWVFVRGLCTGLDLRSAYAHACDDYGVLNIAALQTRLGEPMQQQRLIAFMQAQLTVQQDYLAAKRASNLVCKLSADIVEEQAKPELKALYEKLKLSAGKDDEREQAIVRLRQALQDAPSVNDVHMHAFLRLQDVEEAKCFGDWHALADFLLNEAPRQYTAQRRLLLDVERQVGRLLSQASNA